MPESDKRLNFDPLRIAVLITSDTRSGDSDVSGPLLGQRVTTPRHALAARAVVNDDIAAIRKHVAALDDQTNDPTLAAGGTGFAPQIPRPRHVCV